MSREGLGAKRNSYRGPGPYANNNNNNYRQPEPVSAVPPRVPSHRSGVDNNQYWSGDRNHSSQRRPVPQSNVTPGADNFSEAAAGGMAGIAYSVAEHNARESGVEAMQGPSHPEQAHHQQGQWQQDYRDDPYGPPQAGTGAAGYREPRRPYADDYADHGSHSSLAGLNAGGPGTPGSASPGVRTPSRSPHAFANDVYTDDPYQNYSRHPDPHLGVVDPNDIADDGDEGLEYRRKTNRSSMISLGGSSRRAGRDPSAAAAVVGAGAVAGAGVGAGAALGALASRSVTGSSGGQYAPVQNVDTAYPGHGGSTGALDAGRLGGPPEKSNLHTVERKSRKTRLWILGAIGVLIVAGVVLGIVFGVVLKNKKSGGSPANNNSGTAAGDTAANGDLDLNSPEIQALLNNPNLHKVFPGIDYTPLNTQYPDCLSNPPSQNNITRDLAVLSQLTNTIRLYGTDCNQTEMLLHSVKQLKLDNTVKVWLGVWQDNNATTNARQLAQMWDILDTYGADPFKGLIVANEILFRQQMTVAQLSTLLETVRTNLTAKSMSLPVATSDLGDNWTAELAQASDYVMANIHPFFGGVNAKDAASWTYSFWTNNNGAFFKQDTTKNVISETGWPSQGGTDCGTTTVTSCPDASVAGIQQMNQFMSDWVCQALTNNTQYFWFEAFDEPWKIEFDTGDQNWEDHWGLMDVDRNLKSGVSIPDCGGKTV